MRNIKGFTLMEIMITVIIVGIIASLGIVQFGTVIERTTAQRIKMRLLEIVASQKRYATENNNDWANNLGDLDFERGVGAFGRYYSDECQWFAYWDWGVAISR